MRSGKGCFYSKVSSKSLGLRSFSEAQFLEESGDRFALKSRREI